MLKPYVYNTIEFDYFFSFLYEIMEWTRTKNALSLYNIVPANDTVVFKIIYLVMISLFFYDLLYIYMYIYIYIYIYISMWIALICFFHMNYYVVMQIMHLLLYTLCHIFRNTTWIWFHDGNYIEVHQVNRPVAGWNQLTKISAACKPCCTKYASKHRAQNTYLIQKYHRT